MRVQDCDVISEVLEVNLFHELQILMISERDVESNNSRNEFSMKLLS